MTYLYIYFNQFNNVLECYEETTGDHKNTENYRKHYSTSTENNKKVQKTLQ